MKPIALVIAAASFTGCVQQSDNVHFGIRYGNSPDVRIAVDGKLIELGGDYDSRMLNIDDLIAHDPFTVTLEISPNPSSSGTYAFGLTRFDEDGPRVLFDELIGLPLQNEYRKTWTIKK